MANAVILENIELSDVLLTEMFTYTKEQNPFHVYFDHNDEIDISDIQKAFESNEEHKINALENIIADNNDQWYQTYLYHIQDIVKHFQSNIAKELNVTVHQVVVEETAKLLYDDLSSIMELQINLERLTPTVTTVIQLHSNYDCINSHWYENQNGYSYEGSYFGHVVDLLQFNPAELKPKLETAGFNLLGNWPNFPDRKPVVDMDKFIVERINDSCGAGLFSFLGRIDSYNLLENTIGTVTVPKGNTCGFYSYMQGGGSIFELELIEDFVMPLGKTLDSKYDFLKVEVDEFEKYPIKDCHGVNDSFFGKLITIKPFENENNI